MLKSKINAKPPRRKKREGKKKEISPNSEDLLLVKHPPEEFSYSEGSHPRLPNTYIPLNQFYLELDVDDHLEFSSIRENARETRSPFDFLQYFVVCHKNKVYPPLPILEWLFSGFKKYLHEGGACSLEKALGLTGERGKIDNFSKLANHFRDRWLCQQMYMFIHTFKISIEDAAFIVASFQTGQKGEYEHPNFLFSVNPLEAQTIESKYKKDPQWKAMKNSMDSFKWDKEFSGSSPEEKRRMLGRVEYRLLPLKIQNLHPDYTSQKSSR